MLSIPVSRLYLAERTLHRLLIDPLFFYRHLFWLFLSYAWVVRVKMITLFTRSLQLEMRHPLLKIRDYCSFQSPRKCICLSVAPV